MDYMLILVPNVLQDFVAVFVAALININNRDTQREAGIKPQMTYQSYWHQINRNKIDTWYV